LIRKLNRGVSKESTVTGNISATGASVVCSLKADIGDRIKFACEKYDFYTIGIVRNRGAKSAEGTLHIEFVDNRFPIEKIMSQRPDDAP